MHDSKYNQYMPVLSCWTKTSERFTDYCFFRSAMKIQFAVILAVLGSLKDFTSNVLFALAGSCFPLVPANNDYKPYSPLLADRKIVWQSRPPFHSNFKYICNMAPTCTWAIYHYARRVRGYLYVCNIRSQKNGGKNNALARKQKSARSSSLVIK